MHAKKRIDVNGARWQAKIRGLRVYVGTPCRVCGGVDRYTSNAACVSCSLGRHVAKRRDRRKPPLLPTDYNHKIMVFGKPK